MNASLNNTDDLTITPSHEMETEAVRLSRLILYPTFSFIGLIGNSLVAYFTVRTRATRTMSGMLILNLCISDLLVVLMYLPFDLTYVEFYKWKWPFGEFMCKFVNTLTGLSVTVSGTTLIFISCDRRRFIIHPLSEPFSRNIRLFIIGVIWFYSTFVLLPFIFALKVFPTGECGMDVSFWRNNLEFQITYVCLIFLPQFGVPAVCIIASYLKITIFLKKYQNELQTMFCDLGDVRRLAAYRSKQNLKTLRILTGLVLLYIICVLPHQVVLLMVIFNLKYLSNPIMRHMHEFTRLLMCANSCLNALLYGGLSRRFRDLIVGIVSPKKRTSTINESKTNRTWSSIVRVKLNSNITNTTNNRSFPF